ELTYQETVLHPGGAGAAEVRARTLTPDDALLEYLVDHGLRRISKRLVRSGALDVVATAAPGIRDILVLGKVKQRARAGAADLIVLDAPAAGHAITFLMSSRGLLDAVRVGPVRAQAEDVLELLTDRRRCQVVLVTLPEETPVNELVETAFALEDRVGVSLGPVVVNGIYPELDGLDVDPEHAPEAARRGRRTVVVTIDPAKRLADALGLEGLTNDPALIHAHDEGEGELWAMMLDTKSTFDALVAHYAPDARQAASILENRFYRNIAGALSGTQEYMAMEKLYELHEEGRFDLIVVDTPPSRNALDFLDAPRRLTRFLDNRLFRLLMMPTRAYLKAVNVATQTFLRAVSRVIGTEVVQDAVAFFQAFEGMEDGFRD